MSGNHLPVRTKEPPRENSAGSENPRIERVVNTRELLCGLQRVWIEHAAERYLLQVTRSGKLILTK